MYKLSVGALFKNESHSMKEWLEHYLFHGVEHFYLINDGSTDHTVEVLKPYIENGKVTLFNATWEYYLGRQRDMYNHYLLPILKESEWLIVVDLDEYLWSPTYIDLKNIFDNCKHIGQIQVGHTLFGSNGHEEQPRFLLNGFTKRSAAQPYEEYGNFKYIVNSGFQFSSLNVHHATFVNKEDETNKFIILGPEHLILNHYSCQSKEFWRTVKCTRGDSDNYLHTNRNETFNRYDKNDVDDFRLWEQNKNIRIYSEENI